MKPRRVPFGGEHLRGATADERTQRGERGRRLGDVQDVANAAIAPTISAVTNTPPAISRIRVGPAR